MAKDYVRSLPWEITSDPLNEIKQDKADASYPDTSVPAIYHDLAPFRLRLNLPDFLKLALLNKGSYDVNNYTRGGIPKSTKTNQQQITGLINQIRKKEAIGERQDFFNRKDTLNKQFDKLYKQPPTPQATASRDTSRTSLTGTSAEPDPLTLVDIVRQVEIIRNTPDLVLLINPRSFELSLNKIQQHQDATRTGTVFQSLLGEEQPKISCSGQIGAYLASARNPDIRGANVDRPAGKTDGISFFSKRDSLSFHNFLSLFNLYLNNGYIYDTVGLSRANHYVGYVSIIWDGWEYQGNFESFNYSYAEDKQNGALEYDFTFSVGKMLEAL